MFNGISLDLNKFGFYFWFIFFGFVTLIISIIYNDRYVELGLLISMYGMIAFLLDLLFDRVTSKNIKETLTPTNMFKVSNKGHVLRFFAHLVLIAILLILLEDKYNFI